MVGLPPSRVAVHGVGGFHFPRTIYLTGRGWPPPPGRRIVDGMKPGQRNPNSRRARVEGWLHANPGMHRCRDIARGLGEDTHPVAVACYGLLMQGTLRRATIPAENGGRAFTVYGLAKQPAKT